MPRVIKEYYAESYHESETILKSVEVLRILSADYRRAPDDPRSSRRFNLMKVFKETLCRAYNKKKKYLMKFYEPWLNDPMSFVLWAERRRLKRLIRIEKHMGYFPSNIELSPRTQRSEEEGEELYGVKINFSPEDVNLSLDETFQLTMGEPFDMSWTETDGGD